MCGPTLETLCRLTIVGGVRDALVVWRLGRCEIVRPRRHRALLGGPSTSPLDGMDTPSPRVTLEQVLNGVGQVAVAVGALCLTCGALGIPLRRPEIAYLTLLLGLVCYLVVTVRTGDGRRVLRQVVGSAMLGAALGAVIQAGALVRMGEAWLTVALLLAGAAAMVGGAKVLLRGKANEGR
jgi:hypothetical protein